MFYKATQKKQICQILHITNKINNVNVNISISYQDTEIYYYKQSLYNLITLYVIKRLTEKNHRRIFVLADVRYEEMRISPARGEYINQYIFEAFLRICIPCRASSGGLRHTTTFSTPTQGVI